MKSLIILTLLACPVAQDDMTDIWNLPPLEIESGRFSTDWDTLSRYYNVPEWWREAKFGAWSHWDPQSAAEYGDWYARGMYIPRNEQYRYHLEHYGRPSEYGYKDLCNDWVIDRWDPDELMQLYIRMGARYFLAMGNHHDNFDCWDSKYQPWNSVNVGPKKDIVGIWKETADKYGMPFGIGFHATPARTWGQFMTVRYTTDSDALLTKEDGIGKWWEGLDPKDLYGPEHHDGRNSLETPFADQFMWRVDDAIRKYRPDMIYFDDHAGDSQIDLGINMGFGKLTPRYWLISIILPTNAQQVTVRSWQHSRAWAAATTAFKTTRNCCRWLTAAWSRAPNSTLKTGSWHSPSRPKSACRNGILRQAYHIVQHRKSY